MPDEKSQPMGWRGGNKKPTRQAKYGWKSDSKGPQTSWWMRRTTQFSLLLGIFMCVAVVVALILSLQGQDAATIILVGVNPADHADKLDTPLDLHGWQGGLKLARWVKTQQEKRGKSHSWLDWGRKNLEVQTDRDTGKPFSLSNKNLPDVINLIANAKGVVVVYFGMIGLARDGEPVLYGAGGDYIPVRSILEKLKPVASNRHADSSIVLLFDAARVTLHAESGLLHNDFVRALQDKLTPVIQEIPHCTVICSSGPGETAWNSDEFGSSVFLAHVLDALQGKTKLVDNQNNVTLERFFNHVKKQTTDWTSKRFVTWQSPIILPGKEVVSSNIVLVQHVENPEEMEAAPVLPAKTVWADLDDYQRKAEQLAGKMPGPEVYTPLHWQRFRALTQRLQQCLRLVDQDTKVDTTCGDAVQKIKTELDSLHAAMENSRVPTMQRVRDTSLVWKTIFEQNAAARNQAADTILTNASQASTPPAGVEDHLAWMLVQFWKDQKPGDEQKAGWKLAVETRYLAERATFAASDFSGCLYSERIWPLVKTIVEDADQQRRQGEDMLFTHDFAKAQAPLEKARDAYLQILKKIPRMQKALSLYHRAASEATCLTQWHLAWIADAAVNYSDQEKGINDLWREIHQLHKQLLALKSVDAPENQWTSMEAACNLVQDKLNLQYAAFKQTTSSLANQQKGRFQRELMLSFPWPLGATGISNANRKILLEELLSSSLSLHGPDATEFKPIKSENSTSDMVRQRFSMEFARLGDVHSSPSESARQLELLPRSGPWETQADALATRLAFEYQQLSTDGSKQPKRPGSPLSPDQAEYFSRFTLTLLPLERQEPALVNRQRLWTDLLHDQARRVCLDHWYDNKMNPYFQFTAQKFLSDAPEANRTVPDDIKAMLDPARTLQFPNAQSLVWTSELERSWPLEVINQLPPTITGQAAIWADAVKDPANATADSAITLEQGSIRQAVVLGSKTERVLQLKAADSNHLDQKKLKVIFKPRLFFRGLELESELQVEVNRQPQLMVTQVQPMNGATFSVCSDRDLKIGLGHLAIVMDYSASMNRGSTKRITHAINGLVKLLNELPAGVNISIRIFSDHISAPWNDNDPETDYGKRTEKIRSWLFCKGTLQRKNNEIFFTGSLYDGGGATDKLQPANAVPLARIENLLQQLQPANLTPLIKSMEECLQEDIRKSGKPLEDITMLVLTDGADSSQGVIESLIEQNNSAKITHIVQTNRERIQRTFGQENVCIRVVYFNEGTTATDNIEWSVAEQQFTCLKEFNQNPGEILRVTEPTSLIKSLNESLRPKIQLTEKSTGAIVKLNNQNYFPAPRLETLRFADAIIYPDPVMLAPGDYESSVWAGRKQPITFSQGDHLFLKLLNDESNQVKYSREMFYHIWKREVNQDKQFRQEGNWHLTLAEVRKLSERGTERRHVTATLENAEKQTVTSRDTLKQYRPGLVWWDVKAIDDRNGNELLATGTVHVTNRDYYLAPAWDIDQCPQEDKELQLQAWVSDSSPPISESLKFKVGKLDPRAPFVEKMGAMTVSLSLEKHRLIDKCHTPSEKEELCLVLRVRHDQGKRYLFQARGIFARRVDHHYFDQAQTTTVYFSPLSEAFAQEKEKEIVLEAIDISQWMQQRKPTIGIRVPTGYDWPGPLLPVRKPADGQR